MQSIQELMERALAHIAQADSLAMLDQARVQYVGKAGEMTTQMKALGGLPPEERKPFGQAVNTAKLRIEEAIEQRREGLQAGAKTGPDLDVSLPGRRRWPGHVPHHSHCRNHEDDPDEPRIFLRRLSRY